MSENMSYTEAFHELRDLQRKWRDQCYTLSTEDQDRYELLKAVRQTRLAQLQADGRVYVGGMQS